ncbi:TetR/AcrR family transcriptional regulator [Nonomuraea aurantiaca]|uniref:TetR/AcrR family transcriptional regulator n=1 Tax=Nonomuraea aurantiaca TaxID=2878562 RepID=UPI001CD9832F|nr:TetR/AcrR family transcriptional regulator [Nonomuraea aurantiaca]MCA2222057.1 TetR/AcrR family transcriptional regulator [Nonomuraea aurantiaca]
MSPRTVDKAARRKEILTAAVRVFARKGFAATRIDDIAAEAGIAKGSVYLYYDSRDALLEAAFEGYRTMSDAILDRAVNGRGPALERLAEMVREVLGVLVARREPARIMVDLWAASRDAAGSPVDMAAVYGDARAAITELLRQAGKEGVLREGLSEHHATVIVGAIEGCLLQCLVDPGLPAAELAEPIIQICLEGLRRPAA